MTDVKTIGELLGQALRNKQAPVSVGGPQITVDFRSLDLESVLAPLMQKMADDQLEALYAAVNDLTVALDRAVRESAPPDMTQDILEAVSGATSAISAAVTANDSSDVVRAITANNAIIAANTKAVQRLADAVEQQNAVLGRDKTVVYDGNGRITGLKVG